MRVNEPITDREVEVPEGEPLVSKTDTGGRITFANRAFVTISRYPLEDLIGAPHNVVRHPHMPNEAFADLWATIRAGRPWEGLVKNRTKDGDFYWVRANVTPLIEEGAVVGYVSIRATPTRQQIGSAAIASSIASLRNSIVRTTRTATSDADRRMHTRRAIDAACAVIWKGKNHPARLVDVSSSGARLITEEQISIGSTGVLSLGPNGDARAVFAVRTANSDGSIGVSYDQDGISPGFAAAVQRLTGVEFAATANDHAA
jgi:PAS domain S-box-containing protein